MLVVRIKAVGALGGPEQGSCGSEPWCIPAAAVAGDMIESALPQAALVVNKWPYIVAHTNHHALQ